MRKAHLVLVCLKPQTVEEVMRQVADDLTPNHVVISVAASVTSKLMESVLDKPVPVIRTMPNTPSLIKKGMTAIAPGKYATAEHMAQARKIFDAIGRTIDSRRKAHGCRDGLERERAGVCLHHHRVVRGSGREGRFAA